jgi:hypothetical protein
VNADAGVLGTGSRSRVAAKRILAVIKPVLKAVDETPGLGMSVEKSADRRRRESNAKDSGACPAFWTVPEVAKT